MTAPLSIPEAALAYRRDFGWSVIPTHPTTKKPLLDAWKHYQETPADEETIRGWYQRWPVAGVAIVTGAVSGLWVVDVDGDEGRAALAALRLPAGPTVTTGKGAHSYFARPGPLRNRVKPVPGLDTRGDGGYVVAPPSLHPSGRRYAWTVSPWDVAPPPPPAALVDLLSEPAAVPDEYVGDEVYARLLAEGSPDGRRHADMARLVGHYLAHGLGKREIAVILRPWVERCRPPFPYDELYDMIHDLAEAEARNHADRAGRVWSEPGGAAADPFADVLSVQDAPLPPSYVGAWRRQVSRGRSGAEAGAR